VHSTTKSQKSNTLVPQREHSMRVSLRARVRLRKKDHRTLPPLASKTGGRSRCLRAAHALVLGGMVSRSANASTYDELLHALNDSRVGRIVLTGNAYHVQQTLKVDRALTLMSGGRRARLSSPAAIQLFQVSLGATVVLEMLELTREGAGADHATIVNQGSLELRDCWLHGNAARAGGAIYSLGNMTARRCVFENNTAEA
jgi:hypothetical protein